MNPTVCHWPCLHRRVDATRRWLPFNNQKFYTAITQRYKSPDLRISRSTSSPPLSGLLQCLLLASVLGQHPPVLLPALKTWIWPLIQPLPWVAPPSQLKRLQLRQTFILILRLLYLSILWVNVSISPSSRWVIFMVYSRYILILKATFQY